jgi:hypothetical protein
MPLAQTVLDLQVAPVAVGWMVLYKLQQSQHTLQWQGLKTLLPCWQRGD